LLQVSPVFFSGPREAINLFLYGELIVVFYSFFLTDYSFFLPLPNFDRGLAETLGGKPESF